MIGTMEDALTDDMRVFVSPPTAVRSRRSPAAGCLPIRRWRFPALQLPPPRARDHRRE